MNVRQAKDGARAWVDAHAIDLPGFAGAYLAGSICWLDDADEIPATSDVDVMVVLEGSSTPPKPGKTGFDGILLEITYLSADQFRTPEEILPRYHLASSFARTEILADPCGWLAPLQAAVAGRFGEPRWIRRRIEDARSGVFRFIDAIQPGDPFHANVARWLFANGVTTHVVLVAALRNPTVRTRYAAARDVLMTYGHPGTYDRLLDLLGCRTLSADRVTRHLDALALAFDAVAPYATPDVPFAADLQPAARHVAIVGSRTLIDIGLHREAVFWIVATFSRILAAFDLNHRTAEFDMHSAAFRDLAADLGISSFGDIERRRDETICTMPSIDAVAEAIAETVATERPGIEEGGRRS